MNNEVICFHIINILYFFKLMIQFDSQCKPLIPIYRFLLSLLFNPLVSVICSSAKSLIDTSLLLNDKNF